MCSCCYQLFITVLRWFEENLSLRRSHYLLMASTGSRMLPGEDPRSRVVFLLSLSFFGSALLSFLFSILSPPAIVVRLSSIQLTVILYVAAGIATLAYWAVWRPDYSTAERPLGITIFALGCGLGGLILAVEGLLLFFLPIVGLVGVLAGGIGLGFIFLAKGLWTGKGWSLETMLVIAVIGVVAGIVLFLLYGTGAPIVMAYQLWYLRRPHLHRFFYDSLNARTPSLRPLPITD